MGGMSPRYIYIHTQITRPGLILGKPRMLSVVQSICSLKTGLVLLLSNLDGTLESELNSWK